MRLSDTRGVAPSFSVSIWELIPQVQSLSLETRGFICNQLGICDRRLKLAETGEVAEADLASEDSSWDSHFFDDRIALYYSVLYCTIVAAARARSLKRLFIPEVAIQKPFAVRALLPSWIDIEQWYIMDVRARTYPVSSKFWSDAAAALRPALAHASVWLSESALGIRESRTLSREEVQSLYAHFLIVESTPDFTGEEQIFHDHFEHNKIFHVPPPKEAPSIACSLVDLYLPWLAEDAGLAQQVADAWNAIAERNQADKVKCRCKRCNVLYGHQVKCPCECCARASRLAERLRRERMALGERRRVTSTIFLVP